MSPGYDRPDHLDMRRKIDKECFFCHNAYPPPGTIAATAGRELVFRSRPPLGIDCQRCHGAGERHLAAIRAGKPRAEIQAAIVNPARLAPERQLEVCFQCHLQSTSHSLPHSIRRLGRDIFSYLPGEPLSSYILHFDHAPGSGRDDKFEISHSAYRMLQSACFRQSRGQLTCTTCHNPHEPAASPAARARYTRACLACHSATTGQGARLAAHRAAAECVSCHMPRRRTEDAVHVVMTDHRIQRRLPARNLLQPLLEAHDTPASSYRGAVVPLYPPVLSGDDELYLALAQIIDGANLEAGIAGMERLLVERRPPQAGFYLELGKALQRAGRHAEAISWLRQAAQRDKTLTEARIHELLSLLRAGTDEELAAHARAAVSSGSNSAALLNAAGVAYTRLRLAGKAIDVLRRAAALDAELPETFLNLGFAYFQARRNAEAEQALRQALFLAPELAPAHANLATLLSLAGNRAQAKWHFERAVRYDPRNAEAAVSLGLLVSAGGELERAAALYRRALDAKPELTAARFNLALTLTRLGRLGEAKPHWQHLVDANTADYESHYYLGNVLFAEGDSEGARAHWQRAATSPDARLRDGARAALRRLSR
jgi:tetratricopeptide (TPR) repeat protein